MMYVPMLVQDQILNANSHFTFYDINRVWVTDNTFYSLHHLIYMLCKNLYYINIVQNGLDLDSNLGKERFSHFQSPTKYQQLTDTTFQYAWVGSLEPICLYISTNRCYVLQKCEHLFYFMLVLKDCILTNKKTKPKNLYSTLYPHGNPQHLQYMMQQINLVCTTVENIRMLKGHWSINCHIK